MQTKTFSAYRFCVTILLLLSFLHSIGQDIIFKNPENKIVNHLDTVVHSRNQRIRIDIGPDFKKEQNTIFFNQTFRITNDSITSVIIKGSFIQRMIFDSSVFTSAIYLDSTVFDSLVFTNCRFKSNLILENVTVNHLILDNVDFNGSIVSINSSIQNLTLTNSILDDDLSMINTSLNNLQFSTVRFEKSVLLNGCPVSGDILFDEVSIRQKLNLSQIVKNPASQLRFLFFRTPDTLDFSKNSLTQGKAEFYDKYVTTTSNRKSKIFLQQTDVSKVQIDYNSFELSFPPDFTTDEKDKLYTKLLDNFKANAYQSSYKQLDIEYKRFQAHEGLFGIFWWVPEKWWLYGYERERVFENAGILLLLFSFINFFFLRKLMDKVYTAPNIPDYTSHVGYRVWYAIVYTSIIFFSLSLKLEKVKWRNWGGVIWLMIIYIVGIISLAYMANYIIQR